MVIELSWEVGVVKGGTYTYLWGKAKNLAAKLGEDYTIIGPYTDEAYGGELKPITDSSDLPEQVKALATAAEKLDLVLKFARWAKAGNALCILLDWQKSKLTHKQMLEDLTQNFELLNPFSKKELNLEKVNKDMVYWSYLVGKLLIEANESHPQRKGIDVLEVHYPYGVTILMLKKSLAVTKSLKTIRTLHATHLGYLSTFTSAKIWDQDLNHPNYPLLAEYFNTDEFTIENREVQEADFVNGISRSMQDEILRYYYRRAEFYCPHGIEFPEYNLESQNLVRFFSAGRDVDYIKGYELIIDALGELDKRLQEEGAEIEVQQDFYILVRPGDEERFEEKLSADLKSRNVIYANCVRNGLINSPDNRVKINLVKRGGYQAQDAAYFQRIKDSRLALFPSLYEPWGYTPVESLGLGVPTVTTDKAGFAIFLAENSLDSELPVQVLDMSKPRSQVVSQLAKIMYTLAHDTNAAKSPSDEVRAKLSWTKQVENYLRMYSQVNSA